MNKCAICGKDSGKGKTCGPTCRSKLARSVAKGVAGTTVASSVALPENYGQAGCQCRHCKQVEANGNKHILNHGEYKTWQQLNSQELNRVSLPGDTDYAGVCSKPHEDGSGWTKA